METESKLTIFQSWCSVRIYVSWNRYINVNLIKLWTLTMGMKSIKSVPVFISTIQNVYCFLSNIGNSSFIMLADHEDAVYILNSFTLSVFSETNIIRIIKEPLTERFSENEIDGSLRKSLVKVCFIFFYLFFFNICSIAHILTSLIEINFYSRSYLL